MSLRKCLFGLGMFILCFGMVSAKTVKVDCFKGKSINSVLNANKNVEELIIEIDGICHEAVLVERDNVTLIGVNAGGGVPTDGIDAASTGGGPPEFGVALWIRYVRRVTVENLILSGGARFGLRVIHSTLIRVNNCILEDNGAFGIIVRNSGVRVDRSTLRTNAGGVSVARGALRNVLRSTIDDGVLVANNAVVTMRRSVVNGSFQAVLKSLIQLENTDQMTNPGENVISDDSQLQADIDSNVLGPSTFSVFSTGFFENDGTDEAHHSGNMTCESGSDVVCDDPTIQIIGGGTSDCSSCMPSRRSRP